MPSTVINTDKAWKKNNDLKNCYEFKFNELEDLYRKELRTSETRISPFIFTIVELFDPFSRNTEKTRENLLGKIERIRRVAMDHLNALKSKIFNLECEDRLDSIVFSRWDRYGFLTTTIS